MKKNNFVTKYDDSVLEGTFETFTKPSMTEPDNAMSIPEIIARFTRGYGIEVQQHDWTSGSAFECESPEDFWEDFIPAAQQQQEQQQQPAAQQQQQPAAQQQQQPAAQQQQQQQPAAQQQQQQQPAAQQQQAGPASADPVAKPAP